MSALAIGLVLALAIGIGCRLLDLPLPAPPRLQGALLVLAMTAGFVAGDAWLGPVPAPSSTATHGVLP